MGIFNFPYTNLHELNLDWILEKILKFLHLNVHTYVDPDDTEANYDEETNTLNIPLVAGPQGPQGIQGPQGPQGFSPIANVETTATGAVITITDEQGTTTASLPNSAWITDMDAAVNNMTSATAAAVQALGAAQGAVQALETGYEYYKYYEQGTISTASSSAGNPSNNAAVVRTDFIPYEAVAECSIDDNNYIRFYCYSAAVNSAYLGEATRANGLADATHLAAIKTAFPGVKYLRIGFGRGAQPVTIATMESLHLIVRLLPNIMRQHERFTLDNYTPQNGELIAVYWGENEGKCIRIDCLAEASGTDLPSIQCIQYWKDPTLNLNDGNYNDFYKSPHYRIGIENNQGRYSWRFPPKQYTGRSFYRFVFTVPAGSTLLIKKLRLYYDDAITPTESGVTFFAHSMAGCCAPNNTLAEVEMAAKLGFKYVIVVPKVTSDGYLVCLHDDSSIQATARQSDGSAIPAADQDRPVSDFTLAQLLAYDFGIYRGEAWKGEKIPLLEDVFKICAKTGLHPTLSVHPDLAGYWDDIKALAKKYGLLDKLNIKAPNSTIQTPMMELRDTVESYTIIGTSSITASQCVDSFSHLKLAYSIEKAICKIEYAASLLTDAYINTILTAGYRCGVNSIGADTADVKTFMSKGATEITEDYIASVGLNW